MCFSRNESIGALVVGTVINVIVATLLIVQSKYKSDRWVRLAMVGLWQFALLMQLPEAIQWSKIDQNLPTPGYVNGLAYWLNTLQPIVAYIGIAVASVATGATDIFTALVAGVLPLVFTVLAAVHFRASMSEQADVRPMPACNHLDLHWWRNRLAPLLLMYMAAVMCAIVLIPGHQRYVQTAVFLGTFMLANTIYQCGVGSIWCWMVAPASLTLLL